MRGEAVEVLRAVESRDALGRTAPASWEVEAEVDGCLFAPSTNVTGTQDTRRGDSCDATLYTPKTFAGSLLNRRVRRADGSVWEVVGDPQPFPAGLCPTEWDRAAPLARVGREQS